MNQLKEVFAWTGVDAAHRRASHPLFNADMAAACVARRFASQRYSGRRMLACQRGANEGRVSCSVLAPARLNARVQVHLGAVVNMHASWPQLA
ncbi:unnamed protein product [Lampetra planeri]